MPPPYVLRFCPEFYLGKEFNRGLSLNIFYLVRDLTKLGVRHHLFTPKTNSSHYGDIPITTIPLRGRFTIYFQGRDAYQTIGNTGVKDFDLIHTHNYGFAQLYRYKKKLNVPLKSAEKS